MIVQIRNLIVCLLVLFSSKVFTQESLSKHVSDSLWGVWKNEKQGDKIRFDALYNRSWNGYLFTQPDSAFYFGQIAYYFAKK